MLLLQVRERFEWILSRLQSTAVRGVVLVECGGVSAESFPPLQQAASVELSLQTIPVSSPDHAAKYIAQMVSHLSSSRKDHEATLLL